MKNYVIGEKIKECSCGCGNFITYNNFYKYYGIPNYLHHHNPPWNKGLTKDISEGVKRISEKKMKNKYGGGFKRIIDKKLCLSCGKNLERKSILRGFNYCSRKCASKRNIQNRLKILCEICQKVILRKKHNIKKHNFCSQKCFGIFSGKNLKGKKLSKERIEKIKENRAKQIFPLKNTSIEIKIGNFLDVLQIEYFQHKYISQITHAYQCDFFIPSKNLVIECDGDYWHGNPIKFPNPNQMQKEQIEEDKIRTKELIEKGFKVIRLWESEIHKISLKKFSTFL